MLKLSVATNLLMLLASYKEVKAIHDGDAGKNTGAINGDAGEAAGRDGEEKPPSYLNKLYNTGWINDTAPGNESYIIHFGDFEEYVDLDCQKVEAGLCIYHSDCQGDRLCDMGKCEGVSGCTHPGQETFDEMKRAWYMFDEYYA